VKRFLIPLLTAIALPTTVEANWFGYGSCREAYTATLISRYRKDLNIS